uniref:Uncharacterized protein n=1 Tax=Cacopsylla melanoneura TaxID=428564 RepID=A0A8D8TEH5_9HEMI
MYVGRGGSISTLSYILRAIKLSHRIRHIGLSLLSVENRTFLFDFICLLWIPIWPILCDRLLALLLLHFLTAPLGVGCLNFRPDGIITYYNDSNHLVYQMI